MNPNYQEELSLRLYGGDHDHMVEAETLSRVLTGLQRAVHIVAMDEARIEAKPQTYVPQSIRDSFPLLCRVPEPGSVLIPAAVGWPHDLAVPDSAHSIMDTVFACLNGLLEGKEEPFRDKIRDGRYRLRLLDSFRTLIPKPGSAWKLGIARTNTGTLSEIHLSGDNFRSVSVLKERLRHQQTISQTITGSLEAMDFSARKATILYPETNTLLECFYSDEAEIELLDNRREYVQVTGTVVVNADNQPIKIQDVESIQALDLSDFEIREFLCRGQHLTFKKLLTLSPEITDSKQFITLRHDPLDIDVIAQTREQLLEELNEQLVMLWVEFALEDDNKLTAAAQELKQRLIQAVEQAGTL